MNRAAFSLTGSARHLSDDPLDFLLQRHTEHGDAFAIRLGGVPTIFFGGVTGPSALFRAERGNLEVYNTGLVHDLFRRAIFNLHGQDHLKARKILREGLAGPSLRGYAVEAVRLASEHIDHWAGKRFDLYQMTRALTLDVCAQIILGLHPADLDYKVFPHLLDDFVRATHAPSFRRHITPAYWQGRWAALDLRALISRRVTAIRQTPGIDVLSRLVALTDANGPHPDELPDHMLALLIAARETTASLITWLLIELASDDATTDRVRSDASAILSQPHLLVDPFVSPPLHAALHEAERLHSPNVISLRTVVTDCIIGGRSVPRGWRVAYSPAVNHLMDGIYPDPLTFCPDRFANEHRALAAGLLTFGGGLHTCPGKHLAELLASATTCAVLTSHRLILAEGVPHKLRYLPVKAPSDPVLATLDTV
jgi:cytochrome P450